MSAKIRVEVGREWQATPNVFKVLVFWFLCFGG
jgi:hypothetical protein